MGHSVEPMIAKCLGDIIESWKCKSRMPPAPPWSVISELPFRDGAVAAADNDRVRLILHGRRAEADSEPDVGRAGDGDVDGLGVVGQAHLEVAQFQASLQRCHVTGRTSSWD